MLKVIIQANNEEPILYLSAVRVRPSSPKPNNLCTYRMNYGAEIQHWYREGAAVLAKKMLENYVLFEEPKAKGRS